MEEKEEKKAAPFYSGTAYDDAFRTMEGRCDDLFEKRLYMLIPFYIFNYESQLPEMNESSDKIDEFLAKYQEIFQRLDSEMEHGNLSASSFGAIMRLTYKVAYKLTMKEANVQKKVGDFMGGQILDLPEFRIYDQGKAEGKAEGRLDVLISLVNDGLLQPEIAAERSYMTLGEFKSLMTSRQAQKD